MSLLRSEKQKLQEEVMLLKAKLAHTSKSGTDITEASGAEFKPTLTASGLTTLGKFGRTALLSTSSEVTPTPTQTSFTPNIAPMD